MSRYTQKWPTRGPSKEEWLPSKGGIGTGDIKQVKPDPDWAEERLIKAVANGDLNTPQKIRRLAEDLGWQEQFLLDRLARSDIRNKIIGRIRIKAMNAVGAAIDSQAELAKTDLAAYKVMLQTAEVLQVGGGSHVNVAIDARKVGDTNTDRAFFESYHRRIEATMHDPVPEEPPTPEEAIVGAQPENLEETENLEPEEPPTGPAA